jgi:hypothetical protein
VEVIARDVALNTIYHRFEPFVKAHDRPADGYPLREVADSCKHHFDNLNIADRMHDFLWKQLIVDNKLIFQTNPYETLFLERYRDRRLFVTEKGFMGSGVESLQVGDAVVLVAGADVPFIFRPVADAENDKEPKFKLIGEAYVHGIMQGEALRGEEAAELVRVRLV